MYPDDDVDGDDEDGKMRGDTRTSTAKMISGRVLANMKMAR